MGFLWPSLVTFLGKFRWKRGDVCESRPRQRFMVVSQNENPRLGDRFQHGTVRPLVEKVQQRLQVLLRLTGSSGTIGVVHDNRRVRTVQQGVPVRPTLSPGVPQLDGNVFLRCSFVSAITGSLLHLPVRNPKSFFSTFSFVFFFSPSLSFSNFFPEFICAFFWAASNLEPMIYE